MPDKLTTEQRHYNMSRIRGKDTKPEMIVRRYLWSQGFRYRLNHPRLPGKPDIVLRKYRTCIFVNGCFWHGHRSLTPRPLPPLDIPLGWRFARRAEEGEGAADAKRYEAEIQSSECCKIPRTNREFWVRKIVRNMERDKEVQRQLAEMGWHCITVWECELMVRRAHQPGEKSIREKTLESLAYTLNHIFLEDHKVRRYEMPEEDSSKMVAEELVESE